LKDGFYSLDIAPQDIEAFTINLYGHMLQMCALPMEWSVSPYVFRKFTEGFTGFLWDPESASASGPPSNLGPNALKKWRRRRRVLTGARLLPCVDDFAMFANGDDNTLAPK